LTDVQRFVLAACPVLANIPFALMDISGRGVAKPLDMSSSATLKKLGLNNGVVAVKLKSDELGQTESKKRNGSILFSQI